MTGTFRVTFHEWQKFELIVPAKSSAAAITISNALRRAIGTDFPFVEIDGGTEHFDAFAPARALDGEDIAALTQGLRSLRSYAELDEDPEDARAIRLLSAGLRRVIRSGR